MERLKQFYDRYRQYASEDFGYEAGPEQFGFTSIVYVHPDGEEAAAAEIEPHIQYFRERAFTLPLPTFSHRVTPPRSRIRLGSKSLASWLRVVVLP